MINNSADSLSKKMSLYQLRLVPNRTMTRFEKPWDEIPNNMKIAWTPPVHVSSYQTSKQSFISEENNARIQILRSLIIHRPEEVECCAALMQGEGLEERR
jgi:hypothetical protein